MTEYQRLPPLPRGALTNIYVEVPAFDWHPHTQICQRFDDGVADIQELAASYANLQAKYVLGRVKDAYGRPYSPELHNITFVPTQKPTVTSARIIHA